jgi:hypothetical protein
VKGVSWTQCSARVRLSFRLQRRYVQFVSFCVRVFQLTFNYHPDYFSKEVPKYYWRPKVPGMVVLRCNGRPKACSTNGLARTHACYSDPIVLAITGERLPLKFSGVRPSRSIYVLHGYETFPIGVHYSAQNSHIHSERDPESVVVG